MGYDSTGLKRASEQLSRQRQERNRMIDRRRRALFDRIPELAEIDRELRGTMVKVAATCLQTGTDPKPALQELREQNMALQSRYTQILEGEGFGSDALDQTPLCSACRDTGWRSGKMCSCLKKLYVEEELRLLAESVDIQTQTFDTFSLDWYSPLPQAGRTRSARENMKSVRDMCQIYALHFGNFPVKNLFLTGGPGLGKTFLSACIAKVVAEGGFWVAYVTAGTLFSDFLNQNFSAFGERNRQAQCYLDCDLLILDDLGSEWTIPSAQATLYTVIDDRLRKKKGTVISSNLSMEGLANTYSGQTVSRIRGEYRTLEFFGEDIRSLRKKQI